MKYHLESTLQHSAGKVPPSYYLNNRHPLFAGQGPDPYTADKFGGQDFRFGTQPKSDYGYNPNKLGNTFDSRYEAGPKSPGGGAFYEPPKPAYGAEYDPPKSPGKGLACVQIIPNS